MPNFEFEGNESHPRQEFKGDFLVRGSTKDAVLTEHDTIFVYEGDTGNYWVLGDPDGLQDHFDTADYNTAVARLDFLRGSNL